MPRRDRGDGAGRPPRGRAGPRGGDADGAAARPRTFYGQPAYALDGTVLCFFRSGAGDDARYSSFGVNPSTQLDDGTMWPTSWALTDVDAAAEKALAEIVRRAVG